MAGLGEEPRTRRAILGASIGGLAAYAATALGRPAQAEAANGEVVKVGNAYTATSPTVITNSAGVGIRGTHSGAAGTGVVGSATAGSGPTVGVEGLASSSMGTGVAGRALNRGTGVIGLSAAPEARPPAPVPDVGVMGYAVGGGTASRGVLGIGGPGQGVRGEATTGIGVFASSATGPALSVSGRAVFSRSGRFSIPPNVSTYDVPVPGGLAGTAFVIAMLQFPRTGVYIAAVRTNYPASGQFRIYLNKVASTTQGTIVGWIAIG